MYFIQKYQKQFVYSLKYFAIKLTKKLPISLMNEMHFRLLIYGTK